MSKLFAHDNVLYHAYNGGQTMTDGVGIAGLIVGIVGTGYGVYSDVRRKGVQEWVHMALANLKPGIQGTNRTEVIAAINNMMEFLKPSKQRNK